MLIKRRQVLAFAGVGSDQLAVVAVLGDLRHGFVVAQALLHQGHDAPQCLERQVGEFVEAQLLQYGNGGIGLGQVQQAQLLHHLGAVLEYAEHPGDLVEQLGLAVERGRADALPQGLMPSLLERLAQLVPGRKLDQDLIFGILGLAAFNLRRAGVGQAAKAHVCAPQPGLDQRGLERFVFEAFGLVGQQQGGRTLSLIQCA